MDNVPDPIPGKGEVRNWENGIECPVSTEKGTLFQIKNQCKSTESWAAWYKVGIP